MEINFERSLIALDGSELELTTQACAVCGRAQESRVATLQSLCSDALVQGYRDGRGQPEELTGEEAVRRYELARRIVNEGTVELSLKDAALIQQLVAKRYTPLYAGQIWQMLDPKEEESAPK